MFFLFLLIFIRIIIIVLSASLSSYVYYVCFYLFLFLSLCFLFSFSFSVFFCRHQDLEGSCTMQRYSQEQLAWIDSLLFCFLPGGFGVSFFAPSILEGVQKDSSNKTDNSASLLALLLAVGPFKSNLGCKDSHWAPGAVIPRFQISICSYSPEHSKSGEPSGLFLPVSGTKTLLGQMKYPKRFGIPATPYITKVTQTSIRNDDERSRETQRSCGVESAIREIRAG